jgi:hypothetical protein
MCIKPSKLRPRFRLGLSLDGGIKPSNHKIAPMSATAKIHNQGKKTARNGFGEQKSICDVLRGACSRPQHYDEMHAKMQLLTSLLILKKEAYGVGNSSLERGDSERDGIKNYRPLCVGQKRDHKGENVSPPFLFTRPPPNPFHFGQTLRVNTSPRR